jgi:hypothetical protein
MTPHFPFTHSGELRSPAAAGVRSLQAGLPAPLLCLFWAGLAAAEIHHNPGSTVALPHEKYVHVVSEADSPVQQTYIKSKDGLYIAAAIRRPKGSGRYPAIVIFHGAPGGRGMEQLVGWSRGDTGGPVWGPCPIIAAET